jgi:prevent-host-death family protein
MATEFSVEEAQERFAELVDRAESGEEIVITRFGAPSVSLRPARDRGRGRGMTNGVVGAMWLAPFAADAAGDSAGESTFDVGTDYFPADGLDFSG